MNTEAVPECEKAAVGRLPSTRYQFTPDGYNIGINCGADAGQTIFHAHVHLIPRYLR